MELRSGVRLGSPFTAFAIALGRAAAPPALLRAGPPFAAIGLAASIAFGGYGMSPRDLVAVMGASMGARVSLWIAWIFITAPAARALFEAPETFVLRSLPAPLSWFWIVYAGGLVALQAPWMLLFGVGGGAIAAITAGLAAAAASALVVAGARAAIEIGAAGAIGAAIVAGAPRAWLLAIAVGALIVGVSAAFRRAPERASSAARAWIPRRPPLALAAAHAAVLGRRDAITLARGVGAALVGAAIAALAARNNGATGRADQEQITLAAGAIPLAVAITGVAGRVLVTERKIEWLLCSSGASAALRAHVASGITAAWGAAMGAMYGAAVAIVVAAGASDRARIAALAASLGASLGAAAAHFARRAERPAGVDGTAITVAMTTTSILAASLAAWLGAAAIAPISAAAIALAAAAPSVLSRRERLVERAVRASWEDA